MTATDELRRLLDERGVEHVDAEDGHTQHTWWSDGDHEIAACNSGERLAVYNLTPEQAIAATLRRGTCKEVYLLMATDIGDGREEVLGVYATEAAATAAISENKYGYALHHVRHEVVTS